MCHSGPRGKPILAEHCFGWRMRIRSSARGEASLKLYLNPNWRINMILWGKHDMWFRKSTILAQICGWIMRQQLQVSFVNMYLGTVCSGRSFTPRLRPSACKSKRGPSAKWTPSGPFLNYVTPKTISQRYGICPGYCNCCWLGWVGGDYGILWEVQLFPCIELKG